MRLAIIAFLCLASRFTSLTHIPFLPVLIAWIILYTSLLCLCLSVCACILYSACLNRCVIHATILNTRAEAYADMLEGDCVAEMALHNPNLVKGIAASLRTLIIASFRAPPTQFVMTLLRRLNPTAQMLRASAFCRHHEYIFALLCMLNVNMGALDLSRKDDQP